LKIMMGVIFQTIPNSASSILSMCDSSLAQW